MLEQVNPRLVPELGKVCPQQNSVAKVQNEEMGNGKRDGQSWLSHLPLFLVFGETEDPKDGPVLILGQWLHTLVLSLRNPG